MSYVSVEQRRRELIAAAIRVVSDVGLAAASTRAICAEAGVQQSVFHYCFASKEELLRELTREVVMQYQESALKFLAPGVDVETSMREGLMAVWQVASADPGRLLAFYELTVGGLRAAGRQDISDWQNNEHTTATDDFLAKLAETSGVEWTVPVPVLIRIIVIVVQGFSISWLIDNRADEVEAAIDALAKLLSGLAAPAPPAEPSAEV
ncbi:TetR/AcrR family transcriptional regulator [Prescottella subtropica]|uniref:TetR/AcrR family transcriptional regulator n=1 Tax=Prescottella subtropica TaxID=2545757 RepID=UPI0010F51F01|nr:TetR/AcrR family transcriptional regulator [Prescottella subtropica]